MYIEASRSVTAGIKVSLSIGSMGTLYYPKKYGMKITKQLRKYNIPEKCILFKDVSVPKIQLATLISSREINDSSIQFRTNEPTDKMKNRVTSVF